MFAGSYKFKDNFAALLRLGTASNSPPAGAASGVTTTNPILGVAYSPVVDLDLRAQLFFGLALPLGSGSGNSPDAGVKAANGSGALARAAMDNAAFAVNYFTVIAGADLAYLKKDWTLQVESTLFQLLRNSGENVDRDAVRTNLTAGFELGYAFQPLVSMIGELHYHRWLNNDTVFSMVAPTVENLSLAIGPRFSFKMDDVTFKPGISYERGLVGPVVSGGFPASIANNEQIIFVDLPIVF